MDPETGSPAHTPEDTDSPETLHEQRREEITRAGRIVLLDRAQDARRTIDALSYEERVQKLQDLGTRQLYLVEHPDRLVGKNIMEGSPIRVDVGAGEQTVTHVVSGNDADGYVCQVEGRDDPVTLSKDQLTEAYFLSEKDTILPILSDAERTVVEAYVQSRQDPSSVSERSDEEWTTLFQEAGLQTTADIKMFLAKTLPASADPTITSQRDALLMSFEHKLLAPGGAAMQAIQLVEASGVPVLNAEARAALTDPASLDLTMDRMKRLSGAFRDGDTAAINAIVLETRSPEMVQSAEAESSPLDASLTRLRQELDTQILQIQTAKGDPGKLLRLRALIVNAEHTKGSSGYLLKETALLDVSGELRRGVSEKDAAYMQQRRLGEIGKFVDFARTQGMKENDLIKLQEALTNGSLGALTKSRELARMLAGIEDVDIALLGREVTKDEFKAVLGKSLTLQEEQDLETRKRFWGGMFFGFLTGSFSGLGDFKKTVSL